MALRAEVSRLIPQRGYSTAQRVSTHLSRRRCRSPPSPPLLLVVRRLRQRGGLVGVPAFLLANPPNKRCAMAGDKPRRVLTLHHPPGRGDVLRRPPPRLRPSPWQTTPQIVCDGTTTPRGRMPAGVATVGLGLALRDTPPRGSWWASGGDRARSVMPPEERPPRPSPVQHSPPDDP